MRTAHIVSTWGTVTNRICHCRQINRAEDRTDKVERKCIRSPIRQSVQSMGTRIHKEGNRPRHQKLDFGQDMRWKKQRSIGMCSSPSHHRIQRNSLYIPVMQTQHPTVEAYLCKPKSGIAAEFHQAICDSFCQPEYISPSVLSILESSAALNSSKINLQKQGDKQRISANNQLKGSMERPEQCFHCRDLQAEFEEVRAQQRALEDQVRILETRLEEQFKILHEKYRAEMNLFLHRVHSLHEQFSSLNNRCSHAEERIEILKHMMEKKDATSPSSAKPIEADQDPEGSTAR